eukprot:3686296-Pleurochrysis_carterae.AAC.3
MDAVAMLSCKRRMRRKREGAKKRRPKIRKREKGAKKRRERIREREKGARDATGHELHETREGSRLEERHGGRQGQPCLPAPTRPDASSSCQAPASSRKTARSKRQTAEQAEGEAQKQIRWAGKLSVAQLAEDRGAENATARKEGLKQRSSEGIPRAPTCRGSPTCDPPLCTCRRSSKPAECGAAARRVKHAQRPSPDPLLIATQPSCTRERRHAGAQQDRRAGAQQDRRAGAQRERRAGAQREGRA